jgi:type F conjugative transfer system protein TrbI
MNSTLPSRWQEILRREAAENVGNVLAQAKDQPDPRRIPRWTVPTLAVGLASVSLLSINGGTEATGKGSVPFDRSTVISTRTAGLGASAEDLAPRPEPSAAPAPVFQPPSSIAVAIPERPAPRSVARAKKSDKRRSDLADVLSTPPQEPEPSPSPAAPEKPPPMVINIGTRIAAVLTDPVVTGAALAPATAKLTSDVYVGDRLAIPTGTLLVGEGFATQQDDRAQVVFTAIVRDGKTMQFEGWALQDGEVGIRGKLVRKGSKTKRGAGTVLGAAASALTYGLAGAGSGPEGAALAALGNTAANDLVTLGRDWRQSDKVVRVAAGIPITVYIRRDLTME